MREKKDCISRNDYREIFSRLSKEMAGEQYLMTRNVFIRIELDDSQLHVVVSYKPLDNGYSE